MVTFQHSAEKPWKYYLEKTAKIRVLKMAIMQNAGVKAYHELTASRGIHSRQENTSFERVKEHMSVHLKGFEKGC